MVDRPGRPNARKSANSSERLLEEGGPARRLRPRLSRRRDTVIVRTLLGLNPGSMPCRARKLRIISPAQTRSTSASANSEPTRSMRRRERPGPSVEPRSPSRSDSPASRRDSCSAGRRPKAIPVKRDTPSAKANTRPSMPIVSTRGMLEGLSATSTRIPQAASPSPAAPPASASARLSVRNWRTSRERLAPSAVRTATSFWRAAARASSMWATLAQAIRRTNATAPSSTRSPGRTSPTTVSSSERTVTSRLVPGNSLLEPRR